jgi:hypothetical protein
MSAAQQLDGLADRERRLGIIGIHRGSRQQLAPMLERRIFIDDGVPLEKIRMQRRHEDRAPICGHRLPPPQ